MGECKPAPAPSIIEGTVKFRDGKKWKSRWCVMRKLSPVADCVHLQLYKDQRERQKNGQTKASLSLQHFLGSESGFTLDKESNTLALLCEDVIPVLAFDTRESLIQWRVKVQHNLGGSREFPASVVSAPAGSGVRVGPVRLHARAARLAAIGARPPVLLALWDVKLLRRYGVVEGRFCVEGGSRCGRGAGLFVFCAERGRQLAELLAAAAAAEPGCRASVAGGGDSVFEKHFSDTSSCVEEACCRSSLRSVSPAWNVPGSRTHGCLSRLDSGTEELARRPTSLPRCSSCFKFSPLTRSSTIATTPGGISVMNPAWTMDNITEKRSDSDRASIYSRSSGSASEYSVPRSSCLLDKSFESKRSSPVGCCTPTVPLKMGTGCQCWQLQQKCFCPKRKLFNGPYENYDVPKTPMPLIQEHPADILNMQDSSSYYDTPKKLMRCLVDPKESCQCSSKLNNNQANQELSENIVDKKNIETNAEEDPCQVELHSNYVNINPSNIDKPIENKLDYGNYANIDLSATLEKFESSLQILRSAGFSEEDIDDLEDIPEHDDDVSAASSNTVHPSTECCNEHLNYMHMEPLETSSASISNKACSDNISRISHISDPSMQHSELDNGALSLQRPSSADFIKRAEDVDIYKSRSDKNMSFAVDSLRKSCKSECVNDNCQHCYGSPEIAQRKENNFKIPEVAKSEISFVARFRESVKIRRSSSVPSKSEKNRDSSSSNDSGVSTGSLKHHRCDFSEFELPITNSKSCKKHVMCTKYRKSITPSHLSMFMKSSSSDPLKNITFQFEEVSTMTKSDSCDVDTLTRRNKPKGDGSHDNNRISQMTTQSTSSGASDLSDYMESLSVSSFSSFDVSDNSRHLTRPRSGKEYLSIDRALLVGACNIDPQN